MDLRHIAYWLAIVVLVLNLAYAPIDVYDALNDDEPRKAAWKAFGGLMTVGLIAILLAFPPE
ncbi:MAG TPA: hypothetical protein VFO51_06640 [Sphingomicrobium sp.]|nr:hypothetical protein [Sphingomicrobium sp.]